MDSLRKVVPKQYGLHELGSLPDGGIKVRIVGVHEIDMQEVEGWRKALRKAGWTHTLLFDMDDESMTFVLRRGWSVPWTYILLVLLIVTLILRLLKII